MQPECENSTVPGLAPELTPELAPASVPNLARRSKFGAVCMIVLRTLLGLLASRICLVLALTAWSGFSFWLLKLLIAEQVALDAMALAISLASSTVASFISALSLPPVLLACWAAAYALRTRFLAMLAGLGGGMLAVAVWQTVLTVATGYNFSLRHAGPEPVTSTERAVLVGLCLFEAWITLAVIPVRFQGGLRNWLGYPSK